MVDWKFLIEKDDNVLIKVAVKPNSKKKDIIIDINENFLFVQLLSPPDKGKANKELLKSLSNFFNIPLSQMQITAGHTSRNKIVLIGNIKLEEIKKKLPDERKNKS